MEMRHMRNPVTEILTPSPRQVSLCSGKLEILYSIKVGVLSSQIHRQKIKLCVAMNTLLLL